VVTVHGPLVTVKAMTIVADLVLGCEVDARVVCFLQTGPRRNDVVPLSQNTSSVLRACAPSTSQHVLKLVVPLRARVANSSCRALQTRSP
jgi:hypothetical protein